MTHLELADGRVLDVRVSDGSGVPLLFHHGTPGSVLPFRVIERAAHEHGLRLVTYSRPGYGTSTRRPDRSVADVVPDVAALLDHLDVERCVVAGWSGGGPHALACAAELSDRVAGALVIASVGPFDADGLEFLAGMGEENVEEFGRTLAGEASLRNYLEEVAVHLAETDAAGIVAGLSTVLPPVDVEQLTDEFGDDMAASFGEALRHGVDGWLDDDLAFTQPWGFDLTEIEVPTFVWQGSADLMVPFGHGQWLAQHIPDVTAHLEPDEGHLSIAVGALDRMLDELVTTL